MGQLLDAYLNANHLHVALKNDVTWYSIRMLLFCGSDANKRDHYGRTPLHTAIAHRNSAGVVQLLADEVSNIDAVDHNGLTALHTALRLNAPVHIIEYLIESGSDVNLEDSEKNNALHMAIEFNSNCTLQLIEKLLKNINDINAKNEYGETVLHLGFKHELDFNTIHYLLLKGAEPSLVNQFDSNCLHYCMLYCRNTPKLQVNLDLLLRQSSLDINAPDHGGETALHIAVRNDLSVETIRRLCEHGSDPMIQNSMGCTALHFVQSIPIMDILFKGNHLINVQDRRDYTILHHMFKGGKVVAPHILKKALHYGCDPNIKDYLGRSALHTVIYFAKLSDDLFLTTKYLIHYIHDINMVDNSGDTALHVAIRANVPYDVVQILMTKGACPNQRNKHGVCALEEFHNHKSIDYKKLLLLLEKSVEVNVADKQTGFTFLHKFLKDFDLECTEYATSGVTFVEKLLQIGFDPNANAKRKSEVITPLVVAFKIISDWPKHEQSLHVVQVLYEYGANPNMIINNRGQTAIEVLVQQFSEQGIFMIKECLYLGLRAGLNVHNIGPTFIMTLVKHFVVLEDWISMVRLFKYDITVNHLDVNDSDKMLLLRMMLLNTNIQFYPLSLFEMASNVLRRNLRPNCYKGIEKLLLYTYEGRPYPLPDKVKNKILASADLKSEKYD